MSNLRFYEIKYPSLDTPPEQAVRLLNWEFQRQLAQARSIVNLAVNHRDEAPTPAGVRMASGSVNLWQRLVVYCERAEWRVRQDGAGIELVEPAPFPEE